MSCKNCSCDQSKKKGNKHQEAFDKEMQRQVVVGNNFIKKNGLAIYEGNFGRRRYHFVFQAYRTPSCPSGGILVDIGLAVHNPKDKYSTGIGVGLAGYMLAEQPMTYAVIVSRKAWKSLNSDQKSRFVDNCLNNLCMLEELSVSRRAAMGGR